MSNVYCVVVSVAQKGLAGGKALPPLKYSGHQFKGKILQGEEFWELFHVEFAEIAGQSCGPGKDLWTRERKSSSRLPELQYLYNREKGERGFLLLCTQSVRYSYYKSGTRFR
eukprot:scaffold10177_cov90-Skeletonema_dohrnii-CCMP3373.AAC.1